MQPAVHDAVRGRRYALERQDVAQAEVLQDREVEPPGRLGDVLQRSLIRSHAAGSGPEVERDVVRALMLLRLSTLATGRTGIRPETVRAYAALLDAGLSPVVHEYGSLGCSGDLAPLSSVALALMGEGDVRDAAGVLRALRTPGTYDSLVNYRDVGGFQHQDGGGGGGSVIVVEE